jgi:hypothetical protein
VRSELKIKDLGMLQIAGCRLQVPLIVIPENPREKDSLTQTVSVDLSGIW